MRVFPPCNALGVPVLLKVALNRSVASTNCNVRGMALAFPSKKFTSPALYLNLALSLFQCCLCAGHRTRKCMTVYFAALQ